MHTSPPGSPDPLPRSLLVAIDLRVARVTATGDLDAGVAHHLLDAIATLRHTAHPAWTIDASGITFCDAAGLRAIARALVLATCSGRGLEVVGATPFLAHLLTTVGLGAVLAPPGSSSPAPGAARPRARGPSVRGPSVRGQAVRCNTKS